MVGNRTRGIAIMTIIAAKRDGKCCAVGGDSGGFDGDLVVLGTEPKVWKIGSTLFGGCGTWRSIEVAKKSGITDPFKLRDYMAEQQHLPDEWSVLVVTPKSIHEIAEDFSVVTYRDSYCAIGSGSSVAYGALVHSVSDPKTAVQQALKATERHSITCRAPFVVLTIGNPAPVVVA